MRKIIKLSIFAIMFIFSAATIAISASAWYVSLIIVFYQYEDGSEAAPTYRVQEPEYGITYHIDSPYIEGYTPDQEYIECTYKGTEAFYVKYYENGYKLTINYIDEDGNILADPYSKVYSEISEYEIESPIIDGYIPDQEVVSGNIDSNTEINVIYSKTKYSLIINYLDEDNNQLFDSYDEELIKNTEYNVISPTKEGFTPNLETVSGTLDSNKEINVIYSKNSYILTINYLDELNNVIKNPSIISYKYGDEYNILVPNINGYSIDKNKISGTIYSNASIDLIYKADILTLTINYLDENNNVISKQYQNSYTYGSEYNVKSPEVYGYNPNIEYVTGTINSDKVVDVIYKKNDYRLIINYVDEEGNSMSDRYFSSMQYGLSFDVPSPIIYGYTPSESHISGVLDKDYEYTVIYSKNDYVLKINYVDSNGNKIIDSYTATLKYNTPYSIDTPIVEGYSVNLSNVSGVLTSDTEINVLFQAKSYNLIIHCIDIKNNILINTYTYTLKYYEDYEIVTPKIDGYYTNERSICGVMSNGTLEVNVYYHEGEKAFDGAQVVVNVSTILSSFFTILIVSFGVIKKTIFK